MVTRKLQKCPKCNGNVYVDRDEYGWFVECIFCGYMRDLVRLAVKKRNNVENKRIEASNEDA